MSGRDEDALDEDALDEGMSADSQLDERERKRIVVQLANLTETDLDELLRRADEQSAQGKVYDLDTIL